MSDRNQLRTQIGQVLDAPGLDREVRLDALVGLFQRLAPSNGEAAAPEPAPLVGASYIAARLGVRPSRAYEVAKSLPGRVDCGDGRLRFSKAVLDAHFLHGGAVPDKATRRRRRS